jgi:hypothetical protein
METKLIKKSENYYELYEVRTNLTLLIGSTDSERKIDVYGKDAHKLLSLKNCQAIELGYDLDELRQKAYEKYDKDDLSLDEQIQRSGGFLVGYEEGFQKCLEILGDKKCSEEDMIMFGLFCRNNHVGERLSVNDELFPKYQSLQQTEFDVEIVMECCGKVYSQYCDGTCEHVKPLLDADGCLILKRK